ncbi:Putative type II secretion system protein F [Paraburkholderia aspalathi]|uniref:Type II secretion system protein F n=1 Tax=Paraburkholderia aspalathi TaxID=1324617 RepID=A0ABN7M9A0_9BURK|nr:MULTISPECIES: type II secretion system F family protein [Paraburkholderia]MBK3820740.1 type II secretion system F family protein [Paraburkholderia aspalathi]MBK3833347.1 type II secretion system F family protein [Paraburkholderia aspalathi]MBK3839397.1 type II secretion system F family protein [Paraburkholderia aspalathi]MBK3862298.1 type II secretion system F family protein [Paraburkholderia aspalathi]MCX4138052.1 type II secretion system F family protein [Paraburkholderia aspalathi]
MKFVLRVFDTSGAVQTLRIDSDSSSTAASLARARGLRVVSVRADARRRRQGKSWAALPGGRFNVELFARELAALLDAGVGVVDALRTLGGNERREASAQVYRELLRLLEEGQSLSAALEHASHIFPPVLVACVKASEQTGGLADSLTRYSRNSAMLHELRGRVVSAAIYPSVLLLVGAAVVLFLLGFVVPRFATLLEHSGRELPLLSRLLIAWGSMVHAHGAELSASLAVLAVAAGFALRRPAVRSWIADRMFALPGIGQHFRIFRQSQFYRTTAMLVDGGIPAVRAFDLARGLVGRADQAALADALQQVRNGTKISDAFQQGGLANPISYRLLTVAEKTGGLGPVLDRIAAFQEAQVSRTIDLISRLIEPAMMIFIGVVIGGIVVLMYMPIFEIASSIQ